MSDRKFFYQEYNSCNECRFCEWEDNDNAPGPGAYMCKHENGRGRIIEKEECLFLSLQKNKDLFIPFPSWCPLQNEKEKGARIGLAAYLSSNLHPHSFILGLRNNTETHNNTWAFPGGRMDYGETPEEGIRREVYEETGLIVKKFKLLTVVNEYFPEAHKHYVTMVFVATEWPSFEYQCRLNPINKEPEKCLEWKFFLKDKLPENTAPLIRDIVNNPLIRDKEWLKD